MGQYAPPTDLPTQDAILFNEIGHRRSLLAIEPAGDGEEQQLENRHVDHEAGAYITDATKNGRNPVDPELGHTRKRVEYREIKPYWNKGLKSVTRPFLLRLINGRQARAPEVTVVVRKVRKNSRSGYFELHLGKLTEVRHWDRKREQPIKR